MKFQLSKRALTILDYATTAAGVAGLVFALSYWIFAFFVWIGEGLDKQSFDAETLVLPLVLSIAGASLFIVLSPIIRK